MFHHFCFFSSCFDHCIFFFFYNSFSFPSRKYSLNFSKSFDPDIKIFSENNEYFNLDSTEISFLSNEIGDSFYSKILSGNVLIEYDGIKTYSKIIGVDKNFNNVINFSSIISVGEYTFLTTIPLTQVINN